MNEDKIKASIGKINMSDKAKERIINECMKVSENARDEDFTDEVLTVEHAKPRRFTRLAAGIAACAVIAGGAGTGVYLMGGRSTGNDKAADTSSPVSGTKAPDPESTTEASETFTPQIHDEIGTFLESSLENGIVQAEETDEKAPLPILNAEFDTTYYGFIASPETAVPIDTKNDSEMRERVINLILSCCKFVPTDTEVSITCGNSQLLELKTDTETLQIIDAKAIYFREDGTTYYDIEELGDIFEEIRELTKDN